MHAFEAIYCSDPDPAKHKKMILVLDNAKYHHNIALPGFVKFNKTSYVDLLKEHGMYHPLHHLHTKPARASSPHPTAPPPYRTQGWDPSPLSPACRRCGLR